MSIAVDQTRLRRIVHTILRGASLDVVEVTTILELAQLAAGVDAAHDPDEHATLQAIGQQVSSLVGVKAGELPIQRLPDDELARRAWLAALAGQLETRAARELAYALAFLVSVSDLELTAQERTALEAFQYALGLDHGRATDLVIFLSEIVASDDSAARAHVAR